jgi:hypothetical protein
MEGKVERRGGGGGAGAGLLSVAKVKHAVLKSNRFFAFI